MTTAVVTTRAPRVGWVVAGGLLVGALDITYACIFWGIKAGVAPTRVFQSVASGLLGPASFDAGPSTAALGLALHFSIAMTMAVTYYLVARSWRLLVRRAWICGIAYGLALYCIMNYMVLPLSAAGRGSGDHLWIGLSIAVHAFLIGLPIALASRRALAG